MMDGLISLGKSRLMAWAGAYLLLVGAIGVEVDWGRAIRPALTLPSEEAAAPANYQIAGEFGLAILEQGFAETTARPMLTPTRRLSASANPTKQSMRKGQFILLGALITGGSSIALLRDVATGKATRVEQGKDVKGITVAHVFPDKVTLRQQDETEELVLKIQPMNAQSAPRLAPGQPVAAPPMQAALPSPQPAPVASPPPAAAAVAPVAPAPAAAPKGPFPTGGLNDGKGGYLTPEDLMRRNMNKQRAAAGLPPL